MNIGQVQAVTTSIFIQSNMNGVKAEPQELPQKDGYPENMPTERNWDGTERVTSGKHYDAKKKLGKQYKDIPNDYGGYMADRNDPKYRNKSQFERDRRREEDLQEEED